MEVVEKICENLTSQFELAFRRDKLASEMRDIETEISKLNGGMEVLASFYEDGTGKSLQEDLNKDVEWKKRIDECRANGQKKALDAQLSTMAQPDGEASQNGPAKMKKVTGNKRITPPDSTTRAGSPKPSKIEDAPPVRENDRTPTIVIDDEPPGPDSDD